MTPTEKRLREALEKIATVPDPVTPPSVYFDGVYHGRAVAAKIARSALADIPDETCDIAERDIREMV